MARIKSKEKSTPETPYTDVTELDNSQTGPATGGQSGDTQGLSGVAEATSESVKELVEEGQYYEAALISGIENAPDADASEVVTTQVPEDDVPMEYLERDLDEPPRSPTKDRS